MEGGKRNGRQVGSSEGQGEKEGERESEGGAREKVERKREGGESVSDRFVFHSERLTFPNPVHPPTHTQTISLTQRNASILPVLTTPLQQQQRDSIENSN